MKLALVIEKFDPHGGGAERSTAQIADELVQRGHQVTILCAKSPDRFLQINDALSVKARRQGGRLTAYRMWRFHHWVRQQLQTGGYDLSLSVTTAAPATILQPRSGTVRETLARNIAIRTSTPARLGKRLLTALSPKLNMLLALERQVLADPLLRHVAAVSGYVQRQLVEHYQFDPQRISVIPNAAVMPQVSPEQRSAWRQQIRQAFGVPDDALCFVFAALNPKLKGLPTLLLAMQRYMKAGGRGIVLLAGKVDRAVEQRALTLGIRPQVRLIGPTRHMAPLYCASDVTVLPTHYDPSSKVVIESLMLGIPAISTGCNGASDFIAEPGAQPRGLVVQDPADVAGLAAALRQLSDDHFRAACTAACAGLSDRLSMRAHVDQLEALFTRIAAAPR